MSIFSRFGDIINSNINAILDKAEDPEKIIRMVIQEMEDTLVEVRSSAARIIADQKDCQRQLNRLEKAENDWEKKAELALSKDREDLARGALIEKANVSSMIAHLTEEMTSLSQAFDRHEDDVFKLEAKLREAKAKKAAIDARHKAAAGQVKIRKNLYDSRIQDAFDRFNKVESRIDRLEGQAEAMALGKSDGRQGQSLLDEINTLEANDAIESELERLKKRFEQIETDAVEVAEKEDRVAKAKKSRSQAES